MCVPLQKGHIENALSQPQTTNPFLELFVDILGSVQTKKPKIFVWVEFRV